MSIWYTAKLFIFFRYFLDTHQKLYFDYLFISLAYEALTEFLMCSHHKQNDLHSQVFLIEDFELGVLNTASDLKMVKWHLAKPMQPG